MRILTLQKALFVCSITIAALLSAPQSASAMSAVTSPDLPAIVGGAWAPTSSALAQAGGELVMIGAPSDGTDGSGSFRCEWGEFVNGNGRYDNSGRANGSFYIEVAAVCEVSGASAMGEMAANARVYRTEDGRQSPTVQAGPCYYSDSQCLNVRASQTWNCSYCNGTWRVIFAGQFEAPPGMVWRTWDENCDTIYSDTYLTCNWNIPVARI